MLELAEHLMGVRRTCLEMLKDQGYYVDETELELDRKKFQQKFGSEPDGDVLRDGLLILSTKKDNPTKTVLVCFFNESKVGVKAVKKVAEKMRKEGVPRAILVVQEPVTPFARQCIAEMVPKFRMEVFTEAELRVNIMHHSMVPTHRLLTQEEKHTLLERYKVKDTQLPRIQHNDPVARYLGVERGQVLRVMRESETAGRYVTYRLCV